MSEMLLAHGGEVHGIPPFAVLFLAIVIMGIGLALALKSPTGGRDEAATKEAEKEAEAGGGERQR